jgi:hypothetical protein
LPLTKALNALHLCFFIFSSFELHDNALALHEYTRHERKMATGFDGELNNFQEPELSSLVKLVRCHHGSVYNNTVTDRLCLQNMDGIQQLGSI